MDYKRFQCPDCGSFDGFRSHPRSTLEKYILPLFLIRVVRCGSCFRRGYGTVFMPLQERAGREQQAKRLDKAS
ncbi:MAG: hypothetical protein QOD84_795 [Acidobacteriaceae bacterium]|jgi:hypothetical protein